MFGLTDLEWTHGAEKCPNPSAMELMQTAFSSVAQVAELVLGESKVQKRVCS